MTGIEEPFLVDARVLRELSIPLLRAPKAGAER
jgi:hypothetical protein